MRWCLRWVEKDGEEARMGMGEEEEEEEEEGIDFTDGN